MKTIKIIDLFNKIVNGEEVPLKIKWDGDIWEFRKEYNDYWSKEEQEYLFYTGFDNYQNAKEFLNEEVRIIEEEKEIEKLPLKGGYTNNQKGIVKKINELIDAVNELKGKSE